MNVEYTGRQFEITPAIREQAESSLEKLQKILGGFDAHVILSAEKRRRVAEITVAVRNHPPIVGLAESMSMRTAVGNALDRIERQAVKYRTRGKSKKRQARKRQNGQAGPELAAAANVRESTVVPRPLAPPKARSNGNHVVKSADSVSSRPLTLEEAVKEAEFRDREVFVFRDPLGKVNVLHRKRDGVMELIEAP